MKLLFLGFDGLDFDYVNLLLPEFQKQLFGISLPQKFYNPHNRYGSKNLEDAMPVSGPNWISIYTGMKAEKHGVLDDVGLKTLGSKTFDEIEYRTFWEILSDKKRHIGVYSLPIANPLASVNADSFAIPGFPCSFNSKYFVKNDVKVSENIKHDIFYSNFMENILKNVSSENNGLYKKMNSDKDPKIRHNLKALFSKKVFQLNAEDSLKKLDIFLNCKVDFLKYLLSNYDSLELLAFQAGEIDHLGHWIIPKGAKDGSGYCNKLCGRVWLLEVYKRIRKIKEIVIDLYKPEWVIMTSDHGFKERHVMNSFYSIEHLEGKMLKTQRIDINNYDLCPTLLYLMGEDINNFDYFDGKVIPEIIEHVEIEKQLRGLGYL